MSNPQEPFEIGIWETNGLILDVALHGDYAYVADPMLGLHVINVSDLANPVEANVFNTMYSTTVAVHGNRLYLYSSLLRVYDLTDSETPVLAGTYDPPGEATISDIEFVENYAYIVGNSWFRVLDISSPDAIVEVGTIPTPTYFTGIALSGARAYMGEGYDGLGIYDISNPAELALVNLFDINDDVTVMDLAAAGDFVYLSDKSSGLKVLNVSDPFDVQLVGWHHASWETNEVVADENIVYLNNQFGVEIYDVSAALPTDNTDFDGPTELYLSPVYPNPFNNTANISFDLPREVTGRLVVYDVLGREASVLYNGRLTSGSHRMQINGDGLSSGTYFVRLESPTVTATRKATLLK